MDQEEIIKAILKNFDNIKNLLIIFSSLLFVNIFSFFGNIIIELIAKHKEVKVYRKNLISSKILETEEKLFVKLEHLSLLDQFQLTQLLTEITIIEQFISSNKLYVEKDIEKISIKLLDYFKSVVTDYRKKNYLTELTFFDEFTRTFNK